MSGSAAFRPPPGPKTMLRTGVVSVALGVSSGSAAADLDRGAAARRALAEEIREQAARTPPRRRRRR